MKLVKKVDCHRIVWSILIKAVPRIIAAALLLAFAGNTALPALFADPESNLPACCRRDGKHHCAMMDMADMAPDDGGTYWKATPQKCGQFPKSGASLCSGKTGPQRTSEIGPLVSSRPTVAARTEVLYRISHSRSREKRGPPILS
jgi:hypothetical protein